ncbi:MAG TPA: YggT family protein [Candidatus Limnocylindrales bacterium]|jgi:uncharacterized protein YggT (Ycf19 family)
MVDDYEPITTHETTTERPVAPRRATVVEQPVGSDTVVEREHVDSGPSPMTVLYRVVGLVFGLIQAVIVLRIVFLLLVANRDNGLVNAILAISEPLVEPFRGMFRLDRVSADSGSVLDVAAVVALIGWTLIEMLVLAVIRLGSRNEHVVA